MLNKKQILQLVAIILAAILILIIIVIRFISIGSKQEEAPIASIQQEESYTGLENLPKDYTMEQALKDGCMVYQDLILLSEPSLWENFIKTTQSGTKGSVRIYKYFTDSNSFYVSDLTYDNNVYYYNVMENGRIENYQYTYLQDLTGRMANAAVESRYIVLANQQYTFQQVTRNLVSSNSKDHIDIKVIIMETLQDTWATKEANPSVSPVVEDQGKKEEVATIEVETVDVHTLLSDKKGYKASIHTVLGGSYQFAEIDKIIIMDGSKQQEYNNIVGYLDQMYWSPDETKLIVSYFGREWADFLIIDILEGKLIYDSSVYYEDMRKHFEKTGVLFDYTVSENRPDPVNKLIAWSEDGEKIQIEYNIQDNEFYTQSGTFWYHLKTGKITDLEQKEPKIVG